MKKQKTVQPFYFKDQSHQQVVDYLNDNYPISLKHNNELVERVYQRYPLLTKYQIGMIIKAIFTSIRDLLVLGKILNFHGLFFDTKLLVFAHRRGDRILPALKVCASTPPPLRNHGK
jgi:hypothetical protein